MKSCRFQNIYFDNLFEMPFHGRGISFENGLFLVGYQWVMGKICKGAFVIYSQDKKHPSQLKRISRVRIPTKPIRQLNNMWAKLLKVIFFSTLKLNSWCWHKSDLRQRWEKESQCWWRPMAKSGFSRFLVDISAKHLHIVTTITLAIVQDQWQWQ